MKTLGKKKVERLKREAAPFKDRDGLLRREPRPGFIDDAYSAVAPTVMKILVLMANWHSVKEMRAVQTALPFQMELNEISDTELLEICEELRIVWDALEAPEKKSARTNDYNETAQKILHKWWERYPDLKDSKRWTLYYETGTFFPTLMNFRAFMARILFDNRHHLTTCVNCEKHFLKRRYDSKWCMEPMCRRAENNERQKRHELKNKSVRVN